MSIRARFVLAGLVAITGPPFAHAQTVPSGFWFETVASGFFRPVGAAFAADGRLFVWEQRGIIWVVQDGEILTEPFIDLRDEVNGTWDHGLLGVELDPDFMTSRHVYLLYSVDPIYGEPDESADLASFQRLTRYTGTAASQGSVADPDSRLVLIGASMPEGIPIFEPSHAIGSLAFGHDGSLFATAGDGASYQKMDDGGYDPDGFGEGGFPIEQDIGAFRAQSLDSLSGKVLRVNPATGDGYPDNPHFDGDLSSNRSRVWTSGMRNPWRATVRPDSPSPGTVYLGDVGWNWFEELNIARGGENFGWPCYSGSGHAQDYWDDGDPTHSGCETIETPDNPGPLTTAAAYYHHTDSSQSSPPGHRARALMAGAFYRGDCYPDELHGTLFFADFVRGWMQVMRVDDDDQIVSIEPFGTDLDRPVSIAMHPVAGELHLVELNLGTVKALRYKRAADLNDDCVVDVADLLELLGRWGPCAGCGADLDGDGVVGVGDLLAMLGDWG